MPNWLASELCMVASFSLGAWKTFKVLKHGDLDYDLLKTWCLLGLLRAFEEYFEFLISWIPFYWLGKCLGLGLLHIPGGNIASVVFERVVIWFMDNAHHILNNLVVPNVVEFVVSLPWRVLMVLFPTTSSHSASSSRYRTRRGAAASTKMGPGRTGAGMELGKGENGSKGNGFSSRFQHLSTSTKKKQVVEVSSSSMKLTRTKVSAEGGRGDAEPPSFAAVGSPPHPQARAPSQAPRTPAPNEAGGEKTGGGRAKQGRRARRRGEQIQVSAGKNSASALVAQLLDGDDGAHATAVDGGAAVTSKGEGNPATGRNEDTYPSKSGVEGAGGSSGSDLRRSRRRRSIGEILRSAVTGDSGVRVRDHLFDLSTASPAPPAVDSSRSTSHEQEQEQEKGSQPHQESAFSSSRSTNPRGDIIGVSTGDGDVRREKDSASTLPTVSDRVSSRSNRLSGKESKAGTAELPSTSSPPRTRFSTRRRPPELSQHGGGDEAGGGGSSDERRLARTRDGNRTAGVRRKSGSGAAGAGARGGVGAGGETQGGEATSALSSPSSTKPTATRRSSSSRSGNTSTTAAAATADSRARRLEEWRKKRAERTREEQTRKDRRGSSGSVDGSFDGGADGTAAVAREEQGHGTRRYGDEDAGGGRSVHSVRSGRSTRAKTNTNPSTTAAPPPSRSRRFRHVERFRSEMAKTGSGSVPTSSQVGNDLVDGDASLRTTSVTGSQQQKRH